jgi:hypothetical protein
MKVFVHVQADSATEAERVWGSPAEETPSLGKDLFLIENDVYSPANLPSLQQKAFNEALHRAFGKDVVFFSPYEAEAMWHSEVLSIVLGQRGVFAGSRSGVLAGSPLSEGFQREDVDRALAQSMSILETARQSVLVPPSR